MPDDQIELFTDAELTEAEILTPEIRAKIADEESAGAYTAERLKKKMPQKYDAIKMLLKLKLPIEKIAHACSVHYYTVCAVMRLEPQILAQAKDDFANLALQNSLIAQQKLFEMLSNLDTSEATTGSIFQLATASGVLIDKANLLQGGATQRVVVENGDKFSGDYLSYAQKYLKPKNAKDAALDAEIVEG